jgi:hypothetical protein
MRSRWSRGAGFALLFVLGCRRRNAAAPPPVDASTSIDASARVEEPSAAGTEHHRRVNTACAPAPIETSPHAEGYALLAAGKRAEAVRAFLRSLRAAAGAPIDARDVDDGLAPTAHAKAGPGGHAIVSGISSYLFRDGAPVAALPGDAEWIPGTSLIRVRVGQGIELRRAPTGETVFASPSVAAFAATEGAFAVLHTECSGTERLETFFGDAATRGPSVTLARQELPVEGTVEKLAWVGDHHVWWRAEDASVLVDARTGVRVRPPEGLGTDVGWGDVPPALDAKHGRLLLHHPLPPENGDVRMQRSDMRTTLVDWPPSRALGRIEGDVFEGSSRPWTVFDTTGDAVAVHTEGTCTVLLFRTPELSVRKITLPCGNDDGIATVEELRFWPRNDTLLVHYGTRVSIHDVAKGTTLAEVPLSLEGRGRLVGKDADAFVVDDCASQKRRRVRIDRALRVTQSSLPGPCVAPKDEDPDAVLVASIARGVCTIRGEGASEHVFPREVCDALRRGGQP